MFSAYADMISQGSWNPKSESQAKFIADLESRLGYYWNPATTVEAFSYIEFLMSVASTKSIVLRNKSTSS